MNQEFDFDKLRDYVNAHFGVDEKMVEFTQFKGGYSNLTFKYQGTKRAFVFRRAPFGEKISKAHDMGRELSILEALEKANYPKAPKPILFCDNPEIIGAPFFAMEYVDGLILRNKLPPGLEISSSQFHDLSKAAIDCLLELHQLELEQSGLIKLGKPEGYVQRQVEGWSDRYFRAKTNELPELEKAIEWLKSNMPEKENYGFIHNDFKYDNLVLDPETFQIKAVLDWEMATVGDPLMDLGTTLAYWCEAGDPEILKLFNCSHLPGNMTRSEVVDYYKLKSPLDLSEILFYYIFGIVKVAVIAQQIYKRFKEGNANDPRFGALIHVVEASGKMALKSLETQKI
jgi:aminoglycoside phosphotransferase (APT) family kinase protein